MRRLAIAALALVLCRADMFPDASNAKLPEAQQHLGIVARAACDTQYVYQGVSVTAGSQTITFAGKTFTAADIGKRAVAAGAGAGPFSILTFRSTIASGGSGYAPGDTITLAGGTSSEAAVVVVDTVTAGAVTTFHMQTAGVYSVIAASPMTQASTSGAGTGFTLTAQFVGAPLAGTITAVAGATATIDATASNTVTTTDGYYGSDDTVGLQAALDATTASSPPQFPVGDCLVTAPLEIPRVAGLGNTFYRGRVSGAGGLGRTVIHAGAPMSAVLHATSYALGTVVEDLRINAFGLADYGLQIEQGSGSVINRLKVLDAKVAGYACGNGVNGTLENHISNFSYTGNFRAFSSKQLALYGAHFTQGCTDSEISHSTVSSVSDSGVYIRAGFTRATSVHVYGNPSVEYQSLYGIRAQNQSRIETSQIDGATVAGVFVDANIVSVNGTTCKAGFQYTLTADCVRVASTRNDVIVTGTNIDPASLITPDRVVHLLGTVATSMSICNNPGAQVHSCRNASFRRPLTDAASITTDAVSGDSFFVTLGGNRTLANPTNNISGQRLVWAFTQDGTGSRTLNYGTMYKFPGGVKPVLTTTPGAVDVLNCYANGTGLLECSMLLDVR